MEPVSEVIGSWNGSVLTFPLLVRVMIFVSSSVFVVFSCFQWNLRQFNHKKRGGFDLELSKKAF